MSPANIHNMEKIPVNIITGFLGAGKTTAIILLFKQKTSDERWAVIINEFGKISIDSQTLQSSTVAGNVYDISGGCICCSARGYFHENLTEIIKSGKYSRIIIEPSGLGGIDMVSEIVETYSTLILMPKICLVDIQLVDNSRIHKLPIYRIQIIKSEFIIFTKCDLIDDKFLELELKRKFNELYPEKQIHEYSTISSLLYDDGDKIQSKNVFRLVNPENKNLEDSNYQEIRFTLDADIDVNVTELSLFFSRYPEILRAKGHIKALNKWFLINYTLSNFNFEACYPKEQNEIIIITEKVNNDFVEKLDKEFQLVIIK